MTNKDYLLNVAKTIWQQILASVEDINVVFSWGLSKTWAMYRVCRDNMMKPCIVLRVSGLLHDGLVIVAYDRASDTYEIALADVNGVMVGDWYTDIYCDELGNKIDSLVERQIGISDEEYITKAMADSDRKCFG